MLQLGASYVGVSAMVVGGTLVGVAALMGGIFEVVKLVGGTLGVILLGPSLSSSPSPQLFYFLSPLQFSNLK